MSLLISLFLYILFGIIQVVLKKYIHSYVPDFILIILFFQIFNFAFDRKNKKKQVHTYGLLNGLIAGFVADSLSLNLLGTSMLAYGITGFCASFLTFFKQDILAQSIFVFVLSSLAYICLMIIMTVINGIFHTQQFLDIFMMAFLNTIFFTFLKIVWTKK